MVEYDEWDRQRIGESRSSREIRDAPLVPSATEIKGGEGRGWAVINPPLSPLGATETLVPAPEAYLLAFTGKTPLRPSGAYVTELPTSFTFTTAPGYLVAYLR